MKNLIQPNWMIDARINLAKACADAKWHRQTAIDALVADGITGEDAAAFVEFMLNEAAVAVAPDYIIDAEIDVRLTIERA